MGGFLFSPASQAVGLKERRIWCWSTTIDMDHSLTSLKPYTSREIGPYSLECHSKHWKAAMKNLNFSAPSPGIKPASLALLPNVLTTSPTNHLGPVFIDRWSLMTGSLEYDRARLFTYKYFKSILAYLIEVLVLWGATCWTFCQSATHREWSSMGPCFCPYYAICLE